jgi:putative transposase
MNSNTQVFFDEPATLRTFLRSPPSINFGKEFPTRTADILNDGSELSKSSVKHMLPKHPFGTETVIQVFHENHITNITKGMGLLEVEVFPRVVNLIVKSGNFKALFFFVFRPLTFSTQSALQHFGPTLWSQFAQWLEYFGKVYDRTVIAVAPQYTSFDCSSCGNTVLKTLSTRTHICGCGTTLDRNHNAGRNILAKGLKQAGITLNTAGHAGINAWGQTDLYSLVAAKQR